MVFASTFFVTSFSSVEGTMEINFFVFFQVIVKCGKIARDTLPSKVSFNM